MSTIVSVGAGAGPGAAVACRFGVEGLSVAVIARDARLADRMPD